MRHRLGHRLLGDGIEHDPFDLLAVEHLLLFQEFEHVPGDRLALAIGVGRQNELLGVFDGAGDVVQALLRLRVDLPNHAEIRVGVDRSVLGREVPHMAEGSQDLIASAQILIDRLRLGGRFHQYKLHDNSLIYRPFRTVEADPAASLAAANMGNATPPVKSFPV